MPLSGIWRRSTHVSGPATGLGSDQGGTGEPLAGLQRPLGEPKAAQSKEIDADISNCLRRWHLAEAAAKRAALITLLNKELAVNKRC